MSKLTPKQEKFVQNLIKGMSQREAYKNSYDADNMADDSIDVNACKLFNDTKIKQRYQELQNRLSDKAIMSAEERMKLLTEIATGIMKEKDKVVTSKGTIVDVEKESNLSTRMKALDLLNKMSGEYIQKIEASVDGDVHIDIELSDD